MTDRRTMVVARARELIAELAPADVQGGIWGPPAEVEKTLWGSPAGKKRIAKRLAALLPDHKTYVEPFAGAAAVLFAKEPSEVEVINDADPEIAEAYRTIKRLTPAALDRLRKMTWTGNKTTFQRLYDARPRGELEKLHRFLYVTHFSYGKLRSRSFSPAADGITASTIDRLEKFGPRLKNVRVHAGDYERVVRKYDGARTTFYLDPPYPGYNVDVGESDFDESRFLRVLKGIKGDFLVTYGTRGELPSQFASEGFHVKRIRPSRTIGSMRNVGGPKRLTTLLVSNYKFVEKRLADVLEAEWMIDDVDAGQPAGTLGVSHAGNPDRSAPVTEATTDATPASHEPPSPGAAGPPPASFTKTTRLIKGADPSDERFVLGIVLEPEVVDAQNDIYSADEVRQAAHRFMEDFGGLGLMHRMSVNGQVKILESYLAPVDFAIGEATVRKGTWLLAVRILADELWQAVKDGTLGGFSIGGSARRVPDVAPTASQAAA